MKNISPCLWYDAQAEEAAKFYTTVFKKSGLGAKAYYGKTGAEVSGQKEGSLMSLIFDLEDIQIMGLNGGPIFKFSPSMSFFVSCNTEEEINEKWQKLSQGGTVRMGLDKYPWAEKYGWTTDRFGVEWQLMLTPKPHKITPAFLFVDKLFGKGEEAIQYYMSLFPNSKIEFMSRDEKTKTIAHCAFTLNGQGFVLMEGQGKHGHEFTHAMSLMIPCESQTEIDHYWEKLSAGGVAEPCGWVKDKYGVSWQITSSAMEGMMANPEKSEAVMKVLTKMTKPILSMLMQAGN